MKIKLIDKYLKLDKEFVDATLNNSYSVDEFWKKLNVGAALRTNRNGNEWKQFEDHFGIQIRQTINKNVEQYKTEQYLVELNKDRICKNPKCRKHFTWKDNKSEFCSKSCAKSYSAQHVNPKNISARIKQSFKDILCAGGCGRILHVYAFSSKKFCEDCSKKHFGYNIICPICGKSMHDLHKKTCSEECRRKLTAKTCSETNKLRHSLGGKRSHSGRGKHGRWHGIWCDSSWELAWVIYNIEHNIKFVRYHGYFEYQFEGKSHKYYPDFELEDGILVEIKGYWSKQWQAKLDQLPKDKKLLILGKNEMTPILEYVKEKYGKDFVKLYEF